MNPMLQQPFFQVTLPLMITFVVAIWLATWMQNKRLDDIVRRLDAIEARLGKIEDTLAKLGERIVRLEERAGIIYRTTS